MTDRRRVHLIGIAGRAMGAIAIALADAGWTVSGSDEGVYEPMRSRLQRAGLPVRHGFRAEHLPAIVDAVIVGKRIAGDNPELRAALARGLPVQSFPQFLRAQFLASSQNAVVVGGVGKSTTTAMLAWILESAARRPDYLVGAVARNFDRPARFERRPLTVIEGDEYASCFDDPQPKFLHYRPDVAVITNLLADHPDIYRDHAELQAVFGRFVSLLPPSGCLVVLGGDAAVERLAARAACPVVRVGTDARADVRVEYVCMDASGCAFVLGGVPMHLPMFGPMNVRNAAMAAVAARHVGVDLTAAAAALASFEGLVQRQDATAVGSITVVRDKASHPESLRELSVALRQQYPDRRLVIVVQPRATGGRDWIYQRDLPRALCGFDRVILTAAYEHKPPARTAWAARPFSSDALRDAVAAAGVAVTVVTELEALPATVAAQVDEGDVVLLALREQFVDLAGRIETALAAARPAAV